MSKKCIIDEDKCVSCGACVSTGGTEFENDKEKSGYGKAKVVNNELLEQSGGKDICPVGAIKEVEEEK